jgi:hypothetical protein
VLDQKEIEGSKVEPRYYLPTTFCLFIELNDIKVLP